MRESYRHDLRETKRITDFEYIRFHAIFHDEVGVYDEDKDGTPQYNFSYVDQIYDGLLENKVRPFIELSFMPKKLTSDPKRCTPSGTSRTSRRRRIGTSGSNWSKRSRGTWWSATGLKRWRSGISKCGMSRISISGWAIRRIRRISSYTTMPRQAVKRVNPRLRVGGPSTAQAAWADRFLAHCKEKNVPVDFVSTHVYGNDTAEDVFGTHEKISRNQMVCRAVKKVHEQIAASAYPGIPLIWSEYNAAYDNNPVVTDSAYMGPYLANTIRECDGLTTMMSYWSFSDVFEEQGVVKTPFYGGFGLLAEDSIPKPAFNDFALLHRLGDTRLDVKSDTALVTRRKDGSLAVAVWNLFLPEETGTPKTVTLHFTGNEIRQNGSRHDCG